MSTPRSQPTIKSKACLPKKKMKGNNLDSGFRNLTKTLSTQRKKQGSDRFSCKHVGNKKSGSKRYSSRLTSKKKKMKHYYKSSANPIAIKMLDNSSKNKLFKKKTVYRQSPLKSGSSTPKKKPLKPKLKTTKKYRPR